MSDTPAWTRRTFLRLSSAAGASAAVGGLESVVRASAAIAGQTPDAAATDETYWRTIQDAFDIDRRFINLNNGNSSPSPRVVHDALKRGLDLTNQLPAYYRGVIERRLERVRARLAAEFGCGADEIAFTRNATEGLHAVQYGLDLRPGDEVLTTDQDYTTTLWQWNERAQRDGIVLTRIQFPVPAAAGDLVSRLERAMTPRTRVLHVCHVTNLTGQLFPVAELSRIARARGIFTIVDGAQAAGHFPFRLDALDCDAYATSLHKWLMAPHGTGFLYVRREHLGRIWPLHAEPDGRIANIHKFEEIGTHASAAWAAVDDALTFHQAIGADRKAARLRYLTLRWAERLRSHPRVRLLSSLEAGQTWGMASFEVRGLAAQEIERRLLEQERILVAAEVNQGRPGPVFDHQAVRVTPQVFTTTGEIDRFVAAMERLLG
jgi:selenocysteine lyase/cysteine desulfurase